jgi:tripartite-type tricarboxylate transporter receptor subunit TctC
VLKTVAVSLLAATAIAGSSLARAQGKPLTLIINFPAGAGTDIAGRALAESLGPAMGRLIVVVNRGGASGTIGVSALASAAPDGDTLGFVTSIPITLQPHLIKDVSYGPSDLTPICRIASNPTTLVASAQSGLENLQQVVERARREPGKINIGVPGLNSGPHVAVVAFMQSAKINMLVVPHVSDNQAVRPIKTGELDLTVAGVSFGPTNGLKVLAVSSAKRLSELPDAPTFTEQGYPVEQSISNGLIGPKGLTPDFARSAEKACRTAYESNQFQSLMKKLGLPTSYAGSAEFTAQLSSEWEANKRLVPSLTRN